MGEVAVGDGSMHIQVSAVSMLACVLTSLSIWMCMVRVEPVQPALHNDVARCRFRSRCRSRQPMLHYIEDADRGSGLSLCMTMVLVPRPSDLGLCVSLLHPAATPVYGQGV